MFIQEVLSAMESADVEFALVGGMALAFHGIVRATVDVDFVVRVREKDLAATEKALKSIGLESRIPVRAREIAQFRKEYVERRNLLTWSFVDPRNPIRQADVLILHDLADFHVVRVRWGGRQVPVVSLTGLLRMKEGTGRAQDQADAEKIRAKLKTKS